MCTNEPVSAMASHDDKQLIVLSKRWLPQSICLKGLGCWVFEVMSVKIWSSNKHRLNTEH